MRRSVFHFVPSILLALGLLVGCQKEKSIEPIICYIQPTDCNTPAIVRDLTGLDGCGKVLELANGQRLEPNGAIWRGFTPTNGQHVLINYVTISAASICMVGQTVEITCIHAVE